MLDEQLVAVISQTLGISPEQVTPGLSQETIEDWDSVTHFKLVLALEEAYRVRFPAAEIPNLVSVDRIQEALNRLAK